MNPKAKRKIIYDEALMKALNFTAEDVEANRKGELSERQIWNFRKQKLLAFGIESCGTLIGSIITVALFAGFIHAIYQNDENYAVWGNICFAFWGASALLIFFVSLDPIPDARHQTVKMVQGYLQLSSKKQQAEDTVKLTFAGYNFSLPASTYALLQKDTYYRIYFEPESRTIVSIETIIEG